MAYKINNDDLKGMLAEEPAMTYATAGDMDIMSLIASIRKGLSYALFTSLAQRVPFSLPEWSSFLHLSERTMQRYKKEKKAFEPIHSEKIVQISLLYQTGLAVFGDKARFNSWLDAPNVALGGIKPKELLDNSFGINMLADELGRIEHGVLA